MTAVVAALAGLLGLLVGVLVNRAAGRFPWPSPIRPRDLLGAGSVGVRPPVVELGTALLFTLTGVRFGLSWELPAFLFLVATGVLLTVIDLQHRLLPNRIVFPSIGTGGALLLLPALAQGEWSPLLRAGLGAAVLFGVFLVLALIAPSGMGMGDVKLAALIGLYLGWLGWPAVVLGAAAGFVAQAALALGLLAVRRIGLRSELPFGPAMLAGAALAVAWSTSAL